MKVKRVRIAEPGQYITTGITPFIEYKQDKHEEVIAKPPVSCLKMRKKEHPDRRECNDSDLDYKKSFGMLNSLVNNTAICQRYVKDQCNA